MMATTPQKQDKSISRAEVLRVVERWLAHQEKIARARIERVSISFDPHGRITAVKAEPPPIRLA